MPLARDLTKFTTASPVLASFDYYDIASGTSFVTWDAGGTSNQGTGGIEYFLTTNTTIGGTTAATIESGSTEFNFDTSTFIKALTINGEATIHIPTGHINDTASSQTQTTLVTLVVYHVDASNTETSIGTDTCEFTSSSLAVGATTYQDILFKIDLTKKRFSKGEKLRLSVTIAHTAGSGDSYLWFDPTDATIHANLKSSRLTIDAPFDTNQ